MAGLFAFVIMLRHSLVYQISQRKKKTQKETKNQKEILRRKFECHLSDFKLSDLLSNM